MAGRSVDPVISGARILVVDDDRAVRTALKVNLRKEGTDVVLASGPAEALQLLREAPYDLVITDVKMPGGTGIELQITIRESWPDMPVVVMTGYGSVSDAVAAMKGGASDYIIKPVQKDELLLIVRRALETRAMRAELVTLRQQIADRYGFEKLVGATPAMVALYEEIAAIADTSATVLLQGPTGTGKELFASAIHYRSRRGSGPLVRVNCAAIPESLLESELFGHEKGAFTGAVRQHLGKFEQADGGTLLLDEIGEINAYTQVKLLRVLENGEFQRVGGTGTVRVDVRVVAATNKDLQVETQEGRFRSDLYYRLNVMMLRVPSLAERKDDIPLLVDHFVKKYAEKNNRPVPRISRRMVEDLRAYHWPGNVRQLEHTIERAVILNRSDNLDQITLPNEPLPKSMMDDSVLPPLGTTLQEALQAYEYRVLIEALKDARGVQAQAARRLGLSRSNLNYRIHRLGIQVKDVEYE
jgi:DNA-binding NtrC family response regulator